jgi:hypothetical protein
MNSKKLFLLSLLVLSTASVRPNSDNMADVVAVTGTLGSNEVHVITAAEQADKDKNYAYRQAWFNNQTMASSMMTNMLPGALVGAFTGASIGYLSGQLFDAIANKHVKNALAFYFENNLTTNQVLAAIAIARLGAQVGSKMYWEKPLRNKIMTWLLAELKANGVQFNEELTKTTARVSAWVGLGSQV